MSQKQLAEKFGSAALPAIGSMFAGGYFAGEFIIEGERYALVVAPKVDGEKMGIEYKKNNLDTADGSDSDGDGSANSDRINNAKHPAAQFCRSLKIGGYDDWYMPSRDELMRIWMALGLNRKNTPVPFLAGGPEAFEPKWYWSSTEYASYPHGAWVVGFAGGGQNDGYKGSSFGVRAVRRLKI